MSDYANPPNTDQCTVTVTIVDNQPPTILCPANVTNGVTIQVANQTGLPYATVASNTIAIPGTTGLATDNSDPVYESCLPVDPTNAQAVRDCAAARIWNVSEVVSSYNCLAAGFQSCIYTPLSGAGVSEVTIELVTDNMGNTTLVTNQTAFPIGTSRVVYTAYDRHGFPGARNLRNFASCSIFVTVADIEAPRINSSGCTDVTDATTDANAAYATIGGGSVVLPNVLNSTSDNSGSVAVTPTVGGVVVDNNFRFDLGNTTVLFTAVDAAGLTDTCTVVVTVADGQEPDVLCPPSLPHGSAQTDPLGNAFGTTGGTAGGPPGVHLPALCIGTNQSNCQGLATDNSDMSNATGASVATGSGIASYSIRLGGTKVNNATRFPLGLSQVVYTAFDRYGNAANCTMNLTVVDVEPPVLGVGGNCTASDVIGKVTDAGQQYGTFADLNSIRPAAVDNSGATVSSGLSVHAAVQVSPGVWVAINSSYRFDYSSPTVVRWTATDPSGVQSSCNTTVTVLDVEPPILGNGGNCSAWDQSVSAHFDLAWYANCVRSNTTGRHDCGSAVVDPSGLPPIFAKVWLQEVPVWDNSQESLASSSFVSAGNHATNVHACPNCTANSTTYSVSALGPYAALPDFFVFDVFVVGHANRSAGASTVFTIVYTSRDSSGNTGNCTVSITVTEADACATQPRCGPNSAGCIDLVESTFGYHESGANRIYYANETYLGTIDRGDNATAVNFMTWPEWHGYDTAYNVSGAVPLYLLRENTVPGYQCRCQHGWEGDGCTIDTNECAPNVFPCTANEPCHGPCENAAQCSESGSPGSTIGINSYSCACQPGFSGINCDMYDECAHDPCYLTSSSPPSGTASTDRFVCPVRTRCHDPDHTMTDNYACTCPACQAAMFSSPNAALLGTYFSTHAALRSFVITALTLNTSSQQVCQIAGVSGCTDSLALNYDATASTDGSSCVPKLYGCMDPFAANFNSSANVYDPTGRLGPQCVKANYTSIDECLAQPCTSPGNRLCPRYPHAPASCSSHRQAFVCPDAGVGGNFTCHDPNPSWPGDYTCSCATSPDDGFYDAAASQTCGTDVIFTDARTHTAVSNYALTRLLQAQPNLRTRVCDILGNPLDDCAPPYHTTHAAITG